MTPPSAPRPSCSVYARLYTVTFLQLAEFSPDATLLNFSRSIEYIYFCNKYIITVILHQLDARERRDTAHGLTGQPWPACVRALHERRGERRPRADVVHAEGASFLGSARAAARGLAAVCDRRRTDEVSIFRPHGARRGGGRGASAPVSPGPRERERRERETG